MTTATNNAARRLRPGLYTLDGWTIERNDGQMGDAHIRGWWYATRPDGNDTHEYATLAEARQTILTA